jgi:hypothetical protein
VKREFPLQIFEKKKKAQTSDLIKIRPVGTELFYADGRTEMTKLIVAFHNSANAPKTRLYIGNYNWNRERQSAFQEFCSFVFDTLFTWWWLWNVEPCSKWYLMIRSTHIFQIYRTHLKIVGARRVTWSTFRTDATQIKATVAQTLVATLSWLPGFVRV